MIDLRSDTVTRPGKAMLDAMMAAPTGDDVYGDDPTVNTLQHTVAALSGKEAALFLPTGTQANLVALLSHCERGEEYITGQGAHNYLYEAGGAAVLGSIQPQPIDAAPDGTLPLESVAGKIKPDDVHFARTRLLSLENTHNGKVLPRAYLARAWAFTRERGLALHIDGARLIEEQLAQASPDLLRELLTTFINTLMSAEADAVCGAAYGASSPERTNRRNGYRGRDFDTRTGTLELEIPKLRTGTYFPEWLLERRKRAERALTSVVATCLMSMWNSSWTVSSLMASIMELYIW